MFAWRSPLATVSMFLYRWAVWYATSSLRCWRVAARTTILPRSERWRQSRRECEIAGGAIYLDRATDRTRLEAESALCAEHAGVATDRDQHTRRELRREVITAFTDQVRVAIDAGHIHGHVLDTAFDFDFRRYQR